MGAIMQQEVHQPSDQVASEWNRPTVEVISFEETLSSGAPFLDLTAASDS